MLNIGQSNPAWRLPSTKRNWSRILLLNCLSNCHAATFSNFGESPPAVSKAAPLLYINTILNLFLCYPITGERLFSFLRPRRTRSPTQLRRFCIKLTNLKKTKMRSRIKKRKSQKRRRATDSYVVQTAALSCIRYDS
jgi:hypothetical protein